MKTLHIIYPCYPQANAKLKWIKSHVMFRTCTTSWKLYAAVLPSDYLHVIHNI